MKLCGIYKITSPSKKIYIGQSINIVKRIWDYNSYDCKKQTKLYSSFKKYGVKKHKIEIICQCEDSELNKLEKYYIELFQSFNTPHGMNLTEGGDSHGKRSDETKARMSKAQKGNKHNLGRKHSEVSKKKQSESMKGKNKSKEWDLLPKTKICLICNKEFAVPYRLALKQWEDRKYCDKVCQGKSKTGSTNKGRLGQKKSDEERLKISQSNLGRKISQKQRENISETLKRKYASGEIRAWNTDIPATSVVRDRLKTMNIGRVQSQETILKRIPKISGINHYTKKHKI